MKAIAPIYGIFFLFITFISCSNEKILLKHQGKWNIDKQITITTIDEVSTMQTAHDVGVVTFSENGTGILTYSGFGAETFTWVVAEDVITIYYDLSMITIIFTILEDSASDYQHWYGTYTYDFFGTIVEVDTDLTLVAIK